MIGGGLYQAFAAPRVRRSLRRRFRLFAHQGQRPEKTLAAHAALRVTFNKQRAIVLPWIPTFHCQHLFHVDTTRRVVSPEKLYETCLALTVGGNALHRGSLFLLSQGSGGCLELVAT